MSYEKLQEINDDAIKKHPDLEDETIAGLLFQERYLVFSNLDIEYLAAVGGDIILSVEKLPESMRKPVVVDIELNGRCIFRRAMAGTTRDNDWWIERKKRTVKHFERSSYYVGRALHQSGKSWATKYAGLPEGEYAAHGGCFPIRTIADGPVVGTITMSGLAQVWDHVILTQVIYDSFMHTIRSIDR